MEIQDAKFEVTKIEQCPFVDGDGGEKQPIVLLECF
jgi:hypothetical protein